MKELKALNKRTAPKSVAPEKIIQFGEGNFLRAFVDWIVWNMNKKTDFNGSVVVVQPLAGGMVDWLNGQDCLYHVNLQGKENGQAINTLERIDVISRALNPYSQNQAFMALAEQPEMRFIISTLQRLVSHSMTLASLQMLLQLLIQASWFSSCSTATSSSRATQPRV